MTLRGVYGLKKSLGIGLENFGLKKVSVLVSKGLISKEVSVLVSIILVSKNLGISHYFKIESECEIYYS